LFDLFDGDGIALIFLDISLDTSTSQGRLLRNVMAAFAEYESDLKSGYSLASHRHMATAGKPNGGQCPFAYRYDRATRNYAVIPDQAEVVRDVFQRYLGAKT
jgi:site-specific DNA recombinase